MRGSVPVDEKIAGMTVNERLHHFNLFPAFEAAAKARDRQRLIGILQEAKFTLAQAAETAAVLLANPKKYGY